MRTTVPNSYSLQPLQISECLHNQFPLHITAEPVHLEQLAVIEGRKVVDVDLASLGERNRETRGAFLSLAQKVEASVLT